MQEWKRQQKSLSSKTEVKNTLDLGDKNKKKIGKPETFFPSYDKIMIKIVSNSDKVITWKSKGLSEESIKPLATSDNSLNPEINYTKNAKR